MAEEVIMAELPNPSGAMAWMRAIALLGVPSVISLYLVYIGSNLITSTLSEVNKGQLRLAEALATHAMQNTDHSANALRNAEELKRYLRMICMNTSRTDQERSNCLAADRSF